MTYAVPLLILTASLVLMWFCCLRQMRNRDRGCCTPAHDRSAEIEALRREIAELRRSSE